MLSIFKGKKMEKIYYFGENNFWGKSMSIDFKLKVIENPVFLEIDIKEPALSKGDKFFNHENGDIYFIEDAMRGTEDTMVYFTNVILETVIDEESLIKAKNDRAEYETSEKWRREKYEESERLKAEANKIDGQLGKSWWRKLFRL